MKHLSIGILAHIDAGKTSTTERLLFETGVINHLGSVDRGDTQTDSMEQERRRGITIQAAVTAFTIGDTQVNLVDTPGHPDFIAEIERVLDVLDGAILVISSVEGVQAQTRVLYRTLKRMRIPCIILANKIDRQGARENGLIEEIRRRLAPNVVPLGRCSDIGQPSASFRRFERFPEDIRGALVEALAENDEDLLARFVEHGPDIDDDRIRRSLIRQTREGLFHPILFGSAISGAGIKDLIGAIPEFLPASAPDCDAALSGTVFKIERSSSGEKVCYAKIDSGIVRARDRIHVGGRQQRITGIEVFDNGSTVPETMAGAGRIAKLRGLSDAKIGDSIGDKAVVAHEVRFSPPMLETAVSAKDPKERGRLYTALAHLAEQDPFIGLRVDERAGILRVSLYGEVQREVIEETLATEYNLKVEFSETTIIHVEHPAGVGKALDEAPDPFIATIGLTVEPLAVEAGIVFDLAVGRGLIPDAFVTAVEEAVRETLNQGLYGWRVVGCKVTMTQVVRYRDWANSTAADHRKLAPLVVMDALKRAGTKVLEPIQSFILECPASTIGAIIVEMSMLRGIPREPEVHGSVCILEGTIPASKVRTLQLILPGLTHGEGFLDTTFSHYEPVIGEYPTRPRTDNNPLYRKEYLRLVS